MGQGAGADVGSRAEEKQQQEAGRLELTISSVITNPADPKEAHVYFTEAGEHYPYVLALNPHNYNGGIKQGNKVTAALDATQRPVDILTIHNKSRQVYAAAAAAKH